MQYMRTVSFAFLLLLLAQSARGQQVVEEIRISGNQRVSDEAISYRINTQVGQPLNPETVTKDIQALWNTGLFQNIGVQVDPGDTGVILTYIFRDLPLIVEVDYRGYSKLGKSSITDKVQEEGLTIEQDTPLNYKKINAIRGIIKELLNNKGLRYGKVEYKLEYLEAGTARVVFNIFEGSKVRIHHIAFEGNERFSDKQLRRWRFMRKTKEHWMFSWLTQHDVYRADKFSEDVDRIKAQYWKNGYKDILVGEPVVTIEDKTSQRQKKKNLKRIQKHKKAKEDLRMTLTIPIYEGRPYTMGTYSIVENTIIPEPVYRSLFPLKTGDLFDQGQVNEWITSLEEIHNNTGYLNYGIQQNVSIRDEDIVDIEFVVHENDQIFVNRVGFSGNVTTRDKVLRRELLIREGDVFRLNFFRNSMLRINQLGFFDVTHDEPDIKFLPNENKVNITVKGQESGVNEINFGVGYSDFRGRNGFFSFSTLNFLGRGETLKVQAQLGSISDTYDLTFVEPWLFDKPRGFSARIFDTRSNFLGFVQERFGFQTGLSFRPSTFTKYSVSYLFSEINIPTVQSPAFHPVDNLLTSSVTQMLMYDTTDHPFFPTKGRKAFTSLELAPWQSGGDTFFYKLTAGGTQYFDAFKTTFFGVNLKASLLDTFEDQRPTFYELFYLGGEESVRGYRRNSLGPTIQSNGIDYPIRGDKLFQFNFEYVIPVSEQFRFVVFYDAGQIFGLDEDWFETDLAMSTGLEMRFSLPVFQAPLRLIWAYKLVEMPSDPKGSEPKFSIGTTF